MSEIELTGGACDGQRIFVPNIEPPREFIEIPTTAEPADFLTNVFGGFDVLRFQFTGDYHFGAAVYRFVERRKMRRATPEVET